MEQVFGPLVYIGLFVCTWVVAKKRGRNPWRWFFATFILAFFPLIYLLCTKPVNETAGSSNPISSSNTSLSGVEFHEALIELQGVGEKTAVAVMGAYPNSGDLVGVTVDELKDINGVSPAQAEVIQHHFG